MNDLVEFLTSTEIMVVYAVVGVGCLLCFIIYLLDRSYYKRKRKHNTKELNKLVDKVKEEIGEEEVSENKEYYKEPVLEPIKEEVKEEVVETLEEKEENLEYTNIEPDKNEAQEELQRLTEVLEQAQEEEKNIDLTEFEEEQEKNAIISIDELITKTKELYESGEFDKYEDESSKPISLEEIEKAKNNEEPELVTLDDFNSAKVEPVKEEASGFKSSPIISPVFGIETNLGSKATDMELENTANYDKLDAEIKKTNEFLTTLKELQKNLD